MAFHLIKIHGYNLPDMRISTHSILSVSANSAKSNHRIFQKPHLHHQRWVA